MRLGIGYVSELKASAPTREYLCKREIELVVLYANFSVFVRKSCTLKQQHQQQQMIPIPI